MTKDTDKRLPKLPEAQASAKAVRSITKATVGSIPVAGAALTELVENLMPDPDKLEQGRWAGEVNGCLDGLHGRVDGVEDQLTGKRSVELEGASAAVLRLMMQRCPDGRRDQFWSWANVSEDLPEVTEEDFRDAAGELEHYGLVEPLRTIGGPIRLRLAPEAYAAADKPIMGWDTRADARVLARLALDKDGTIASQDLHDQTGHCAASIPRWL
jgi:hypothetical protein